ncbi:LruC domain-containing protein [Vibrio aquaticus]|uniref:LruC domain-containing protein n=1 Tax=Vibrio aquaticus TaxID=2496559 RepID=A0A3S0MM72_9VIBR|nr:LruC domain-containing protein [Vibrio aquaticus]RTZ17790.1 LruC domain-containing protein [Vibrio aquaticus]
MKAAKLIALTSCCVSITGYALTTSDLSFESGSANSNYTYKGQPLETTSIADQLPQDTLTNVYSMLPEGTYVNTAFIAEDRYSNIDIDDELGGADYATASVTFLNEGAGYRNTLGYFVYDTNSPPASKDDIDTHMVIFPNASKAPDGDMQEGDTIDLDVQLTAGQTLAFFVIPNGWSASTYNNIAYLGPWNTPFYSLSSLNPETTATYRRHNVAFLDIQNEFLVLGFEDIKRPSGDNDFNDLIFTVDISPFSAVDGVNTDGTTDSKYEVLVQENDPEVTVTSVYPSSDTYATMAFEDRWPLVGDYDFNDVVWRYRVTELLNGQRELKTITVDYTLQAMGAGYSNGFAVKLPNVDSSNVASVTVTKNGQAVEHTALQSGSETVLVVSENLRAELDALGVLSASCTFYRTQSNCLDEQASDILSYQLVVELTTPVARDQVGYPPYDSFIFAAKGTYHGSFVLTFPGMSWQTHFKAFSGTGDMNNALFNLHDDATGGAKYFLTNNNMPWAINIRDEWEHPTENTDISHAYTSFATWVTSSGETDTNWYNTPANGKVISATQ